jgi:glycosyltransferase involved in cell wall biosynthesis
MTTNPSVSLVICTCNRHESLLRTLKAVAELALPQTWTAEVIVVDNASTDDTARLLSGVGLGRLALRYVYEARRGKSHALNTGLAHARGEYILFTDDDVIPSRSWLVEMVEPMASGLCDAVNGHLDLASNLLRPWQTQMHSMWLAASLDPLSRDWSRELIGASMGIRRAILDRVREFDPELGPGPAALGFCEDTLFGLMAAEAGFRIRVVPTALALHQLDPSRLRRRAWLDDAVRRGRTRAYLRYHWEHHDLAFPRLRYLLYSIKLHARRLVDRPPQIDGEGCPAWEMSYVTERAMCEQFLRERLRPRNYARRGLARLHQ